MATNSDLAGNGTLGGFEPFQLFAGESDVVSSQGQVKAGVNAEKYRVMARDKDGFLVKWDPNATTTEGTERATGTITFTGLPAVNETITINGTVFTAKASGAVGNQFNIGNDASTTAANLAAVLNASTVPAVAKASYSVAAGVITVTHKEIGTVGNAFTLAEGMANTAVSAATLTGGTSDQVQAAPESKATEIMAQPVDARLGAQWGPTFTGGVFNHEALVWPAEIDTLEKRKAAFARTNIGINRLL